MKINGIRTVPFELDLERRLGDVNAPEVIDAGRSAVLRVDNRIEDGWIVLGEQPGLGIEFDEAKLADAAEGSGRGDTIGSSYRRGAEAGVHEGTKRPFERD